MRSSVDTERRNLLTAVATETAGAVGDHFLTHLVESIGRTFGAGVCWVSELVEGRASARALACWPATALPAGDEYPLEGTPCKLVHDRALVAYTSDVSGAFPEDGFLTENSLDGYLAMPGRNARGEVVGYLAVTTRAPLTPTDEELTALRIFAGWVGEEIERRATELRLRAREAELVASRARVVEAADEERRRIGRDLHDGVQQQLVALTQRVDIALRALTEEKADFAAEVLRDARMQAADAGRELRELAHGLHPVGLAERGLEGALRLLDAQSALPVRVLGLPDRRLPAPIELTVYYLVSEALTNAVKYAEAEALTVDAVLSARSLRVTVSDDGKGGAELGAGSGLAGLCDRVRSLGGTLAVSSPSGEGTRLIADIPLAPFRHEADPFIELGYEGDNGAGLRMIEKIKTGVKQCTVSLAREWELEGGPPRIGQQLSVRDHTGVTHAKVKVTRTAMMPLSLVDDATARAATGEGQTADEWRQDRVRFYDGCRDEIAVILDEPDWRLSEEEPMVVTWFAVV